MADDRSRPGTSGRTAVHTDIHDVRALTDTGAIPLPRRRQPEQEDATERPRRASGRGR